jgi:hypothetical protein
VNPRNFFAELKRRNVYKVAVAYAVVGWLLVQVITQVSPIFEIPNWASRLIVLAIVIWFSFLSHPVTQILVVFIRAHVHKARAAERGGTENVGAHQHYLRGRRAAGRQDSDRPQFLRSFAFT